MSDATFFSKILVSKRIVKIEFFFWNKSVCCEQNKIAAGRADWATSRIRS